MPRYLFQHCGGNGMQVFLTPEMTSPADVEAWAKMSYSYGNDDEDWSDVKPTVCGLTGDNWAVCRSFCGEDSFAGPVTPDMTEDIIAAVRRWAARDVEDLGWTEAEALDYYWRGLEKDLGPLPPQTKTERDDDNG